MSTNCQSAIQYGAWDVERAKWAGVKDLTDAPIYAHNPSTENAVLVYGDKIASELACSDLERLRGRSFIAMPFGCDALD